MLPLTIMLFFKFLKLEETNRRSYTSFDELELSVFEYIHFYNFKRPHSANDLLSPVQIEALFDFFLFFCLLY